MKTLIIGNDHVNDHDMFRHAMTGAKEARRVSVVLVAASVVPEPFGGYEHARGIDELAQVWAQECDLPAISWRPGEPVDQVLAFPCGRLVARACRAAADVGAEVLLWDGSWWMSWGERRVA